MKEEKVVKIGFFKKLWYSITKFEQYPIMAAEGFKRAFRYLIMLTAIVTIFITIQSLLAMKTLIGDLTIYIQDNIPEFTYAQGNLSVESEESINIENVQYGGIDKIVINTSVESNEQKEQIENDNLINGTTIFFFKDEIILKTQSETDQSLRQSYLYSDFISNYTKENIQEFNKEEFVQYLSSGNMTTFYTQYAVSIFIYMLMVNIIVVLLDALEIALLGWITATVARIKMRFVAIYNMAIYSLTLPMILNVVYIIINYFTNFTITYFQVAYVTIAYIYLAAAIFILKDDVIKKMQEVEKIKQEQQKVKEEIKENEQEKDAPKDDKEEDKEQDRECDDTQGSEV